MSRAISLEEFEIRKNKKFPQFKTIKYKNMESPYSFTCPIHKEQTICSARTFLNSKYGCSQCFRETRQVNQRKVKWTKYSNKELEKKLLSIHKNYIFYFPNFNIGTHGVLEVLCQKHNFTFTNATAERCHL